VLSSGESIEVDRVISAVPQRALERLLRASAIEHGLPDAPHMSPIVSVYLWYDRRWMPDDFTAALGTTVQWIFDKRRIRPGLVALTVSAGSELVGETSDEIIARCDGELRALFPKDLNGVGLRRGLVIKEKQATPLLTPTSVLDRAPVNALASIASWLTVAGDWTQTGLPATIEGAVQSGFSAASDVRS
jgi:predicted NAD/FAD-dependent oxidoreductase